MKKIFQILCCVLAGTLSVSAHTVNRYTELNKYT